MAVQGEGGRGGGAYLRLPGEGGAPEPFASTRLVETNHSGKMHRNLITVSVVIMKTSTSPRAAENLLRQYTARTVPLVVQTLFYTCLRIKMTIMIMVKLNTRLQRMSVHL